MDRVAADSCDSGSPARVQDARGARAGASPSESPATGTSPAIPDRWGGGGRVERFERARGAILGKRLTYRSLTNGATR